MEVHGYIVLAGAIVGFAVGLTGMGGGALMTPVLVLLLGVNPGAAVSSDLVASLFMKPVGSIVHIRRHTVHWPLVKWLVVGSVPSAFLGAYAIDATASGAALANELKLALGIALTLAIAGILAKSLVDRRRRPHGAPPVADSAPPALHRVATLAIGVLGGFVVGMTSVGSGSLMMVALMFLYPGLTGRELVGTDLVQSIPLVASAALGQTLFGHVSAGVTVSLLIGSLPAIYFGSRISASNARTGYLRPVITAVLLVSAVKLLGVPNAGLAAVMLGYGVVALVWTRVRRRQPGFAA